MKYNIGDIVVIDAKNPDGVIDETLDCRREVGIIDGLDSEYGDVEYVDVEYFVLTGNSETDSYWWAEKELRKATAEDMERKLKDLLQR